jgi:hypothetical protein
VSNSGTRGPLTTENLETTWTYGHVSPQEKRHAQKLLGFLHLSCSAKNCPGLSIPHGILPSLFRRCVHQRLSIFQVDGFILAIGNPGSLLVRRPGSPSANQICQLNTNPIDPKQWGKWGLLEDLCPKSLPFQVKLPFFGAQKEQIPKGTLQFASSLGSRSKSAVGFFRVAPRDLPTWSGIFFYTIHLR